MPANPLEWPRRAPDTSVLNRNDDIDALTGETFDHPNFQVHWDVAKTDEFERLVTGALRAIGGIRPHQQEWAFMDIALKFLGRAFMSEGIESLLWNMTAVDALLGEDKRGTKARLSGRVGKILGEPQKVRFEALYEIRSDLVHGIVSEGEGVAQCVGRAKAGRQCATGIQCGMRHARVGGGFRKAPVNR